MNTYDDLKNRIALGWIAMLFCVVGGFMMDLIKSAVSNDFSKWSSDPGPVGMQIVSTVIVIYIVMPLLVRSVTAGWFRWTLVGLTVFFALFFVAHQVAHALSGTRPFDIVHAFDFAHHAVAIWQIVLTARWARMTNDSFEVASVPHRSAGLAR
jgi:surface polysaccharide O-acyltransferase-like enzyme